MTGTELTERVDLTAARCLVALHEIEDRGGWDTTTHLDLLRWAMSHPRRTAESHGRGHRDRRRIDRALVAIADGGVDAGAFSALDGRTRRALLHDLTRLARVLSIGARVGSAATI